jgi:hypothetical protein
MNHIDSVTPDADFLFRSASGIEVFQLLMKRGFQRISPAKR